MFAVSARMHELLKAKVGAVTADVADGNTDTPWVKMDDARQVYAVAQAFDIDNNGTITVQIRAADELDGSGADDVGDPVTVTSGANESDLVAEVSKRAEELGKPCVGARLTGADTGDTKDASIQLVLGDRRYSP